jgi:hypothetical protein
MKRLHVHGVVHAMSSPSPVSIPLDPRFVAIALRESRAEDAQSTGKLQRSLRLSVSITLRPYRPDKIEVEILFQKR